MQRDVQILTDAGWWEGVPGRLCTRSQWVVTRDKKPLWPAGGWEKPENQFGFDKAIRLAKQTGGEPAYVLHREDPFVVLDLDDVGPEEPAQFTREAWEIVEHLDTYVEVSRSGTGLHLICEGAKRPNRGTSAELEDQGSIEVYDTNHYIVLTGKVIQGYTEIVNGHNVGTGDVDVLGNLQRTYLSRSDTTDSEAPEPSSLDLEALSQDSVGVGVEDIRKTLEEYRKGGHQSAKKILRQWNSSPDDTLGFKSRSEADLSFVSNLTFWCREDAELIDACFRDSGRMRDKWDEQHYADGRTYGEGTIQTAIRSNYDIFSGNYVIHE